jgi:hypothetical protein
LKINNLILSAKKGITRHCRPVKEGVHTMLLWVILFGIMPNRIASVQHFEQTMRHTYHH